MKAVEGLVMSPIQENDYSSIKDIARLNLLFVGSQKEDLTGSFAGDS